jgi:sialate O-acetylesterase
MKKITWILLIVLVAGCQSKQKEFIQLPALINSGMVLQRNTEVSLWGKSAPEAKVDIWGSWGDRTSAIADENGNWQAELKTTDAGGPYELAFKTNDTSLVIKDILMGEVWLCSGQSNMEMPLQGWPGNPIKDSEAEIKAANYPQIHLFTVPKAMSFFPMDSCGGSWAACTPETAKSFSASAYFFGRELYNKLKVPIGLIHSSWGGTPAESWTTRQYLDSIPAYRSIIDSLKYAAAQSDTLQKWLSALKSYDLPADDYSTLDLNDEKYAAFDYDDSNWATMKLPSLWESEGLPNFDGIVWFRKVFNYSGKIPGKGLTLHLGAIDDMDAAYVNGMKIGQIEKTGFYQFPREYKIPGNILKEGKNVIAVRVIDNGGGGGIYGKNGIHLISESGHTTDLDGEWKYMPEAEIVNNKIYVFGEGNHSFKNRPRLSVPLSPYTPSVLFNAMINPLIPFTMKGVIWYQGESNVGKAYEYRTLFPDMIKSWRALWDEGNFPFYFVQIAPYDYGEKERSAAAELREAQLMTLKLPNTGMVVTTDIGGNPKIIHPANKQEVGRRLALWALAKNYGFDSLVYSGPLYQSIDIDNNKAIVHFTHVDGGLIAKGGPLTWFEVAGNDQKYYPAKAEIKGNTVVVWSAKVPKPVAVRFGWSDVADPNLFNSAGLPASPFRSDDWKRLTEN